MTARTATITAAGGYQLTATVRPVPTQPGSVHLVLTSTLASAKDPTGTRKVLDLVLDADGARELADLLIKAVV